MSRVAALAGLLSLFFLLAGPPPAAAADTPRGRIHGDLF